jgi:hypothetical protein
MEGFDKDYFIDISNKKDIDSWCAKLNCEDIELIKAVLHIGPNAARVNDYLDLNRRKKKENKNT